MSRQSINNIRRNEPDPKNYYNTTAAATVAMNASQRTNIIDGSSGANTVTFVLPDPYDVPEGLPLSFSLDGGTGDVQVLHAGVESWTMSTSGQEIVLVSDGRKYHRTV